LIIQDAGKMAKVFESPDKGKTLYAREVGSINRQEVRHDYDPRTPDGRPLHNHIMENKLWGEIHRSAKTNPALHEALEHAKIIYYLSKE
jgi:hypothetical protein